MFDYASDIDLPLTQKKIAKGSRKVMPKEFRNNIMMNKKDDDDDVEDEQTHDLSNGIRNHASLLVLAVWTLRDHVAPGQEVFTSSNWWL